MRILESGELSKVSGGGEGPGPTFPPEPDSGSKNNNGYGNGAESGSPPGNSGDHNPQLTTSNSGPRGPR